LRLRPAVVLPIRARVFAPVVEELHVGPLEGLDFRFNEFVKLGKLGGDFGREVEVHVRAPTKVVRCDCCCYFASSNSYASI
jgi:hypothetical protein